MFVDYFSRLEEILPATYLCHYFVSHKIISVSDYGRIIRSSLPQDAARVLLDRVSLQMQSGNSIIFNKMLLIMEYHGVIAAKRLSQEIRGKLTTPMCLDDLASGDGQSKLYANNECCYIHAYTVWALYFMVYEFRTFRRMSSTIRISQKTATKSILYAATILA